jgi:hypothetical protein
MGLKQEAQGPSAQLTRSRHRKEPDLEISYLWQYTDFKLHWRGTKPFAGASLIFRWYDPTWLSIVEWCWWYLTENLVLIRDHLAWNLCKFEGFHLKIFEKREHCHCCQSNHKLAMRNSLDSEFMTTWKTFKVVGCRDVVEGSWRQALFLFSAI